MEELGRLISKGELRLFKHLIYHSCVISLQALKKNQKNGTILKVWIFVINSYYKWSRNYQIVIINYNFIKIIVIILFAIVKFYYMIFVSFFNNKIIVGDDNLSLF